MGYFWKGFPFSSAGKESACNVGDLGFKLWDDPLEKGAATLSSILAWRIPWTEEPGKSVGPQRDTYYSAMERDKLTHTTTWTEVKKNLNKSSRAEKIYYMTALI